MNKANYLAVYYGDIFDYPLTDFEINKWAINSKSIKVLKYQSIKGKDSCYYLHGREKIIKLRQQRKKYSNEKLLIAQKTAQILQTIPFIKLIAVTGALAMENSDKNDDIDLMIISQKNRVWLTRILCLFLLSFLGKRRHPNDRNVRNKICLNMFLDESTLTIENQNLYTAHEVSQIKPLANRDQTYEKFLSANKWVKKFLPNAISIKGIRYQGIKGNNLIINFLENILYKFQYWYMKSKITREIIEPHRIFFHPRDTSKIVLEEFEKIIKRKFEG